MSLDTHAQNASNAPTPEVVEAAAALVDNLTAMAETGLLTTSPAHLVVLRAYRDGYRAGFTAGRAQP
jgi:hypothetical protein